VNDKKAKWSCNKSIYVPVGYQTVLAATKLKVMF